MYIEKELNFIEEKLNKINQALVPDLQLTEMQTKGNLLKLYPHLDCIEKKKNGFLVSNIFSKNQEKIFIDIDPRLSISQNMQRHFRNYRKSQTRNKILKKKKTELEFRRNYLQKQLKNGDDFHFPIPQKKDTSPPEFFEPGVIKYLTPSGNMILVGKNEKANHNLVTRFSRRDDYWFHVRDYPGSHVLFRVTQNPETIHHDFHLAAQIAAYYSSVRNDSNVNVIYASIQNVKTLPHAGLGKVTFRNEKNMNVTPEIPSGLRKI